MLNIFSFQENLKNLLKEDEQAKYLLAVSGGVDSMVLVDFFAKSGFDFHVAHINYGLRGEDSDSEEKLVEAFCKKYNIQFHLYQVPKNEQPSNSVQIWARNLRYDFFKKILATENLDYIVTAHHLNDQLETFVINLSRGSGIKGLTGIPKNENRILRPLLPFSKSEIYDYAKENSIEFREDKSNLKNDYLRNQIRNEIVPELLKIKSQFLQNFDKSITLLQQVQSFLEEEIQTKSEHYFQKNEKEIIINKILLSNENQLIRFELMKKMGFDNETEIDKIFTAKTGSIFYSNQGKLIVDRDEFIFDSNTENENPAETIVLEIGDNNEIMLPQNVMDEIKAFGSCSWFLDANEIEFPLKLRHKKQGDWFLPIGMIGKKKVSKFFKDEKLSILAKPKIWLLVDAKDSVIGVLPFRQDRRFASTTDSKNILKLIL